MKQKRRLRSVILISAVSAVACGGRAEDSGHDGAPGSPRSTSGGDGDEFVGEVSAPPPQSTGDMGPCCEDDYLLGAGAGNVEDDDVEAPGDVYSRGGAGGASAGEDDFVGIR